jgi:carboxyvinyl-carboxyphosphonate phosphorylmutase
MSRFQMRRQRLREILAGQRCVYPASVFDPISARLAEASGFECGMLAGSVASFAVLGAPDLILLTLTEFAAQAQRITRASELPLLCDADHGYGNALNAMRTVEELECAGVAGFSLEDTDLPQAYGTNGAPSLLTPDAGEAKLRAALEARRDPGLVLAGRTSAPAISGLADTIVRLRRYQATGVDAIFLVGVKSRDELDAIAGEARLPLILGGAGAALFDLDYLSSRGVRICLQGHQPFQAAVAALAATYQALRQGTAPQQLAGIASDELMRQVTRAADYTRWSRDYLD